MAHEYPHVFRRPARGGNQESFFHVSRKTRGIHRSWIGRGRQSETADGHLVDELLMHRHVKGGAGFKS